MTAQVSSLIKLGTPQLSAHIDPKGAQLSVLRDAAGNDLLWDGDPKVWSGRAPLLFPIVGALANGAYRIGEQTYRLPRHGFARDLPFLAETIDSTSVRFTLHASPETLGRYPFRFELHVVYALAGPSLSITATVCNHDDRRMPASFGFHPALRWPLPFSNARASHWIEFDEPESEPVRRLDAAGLLLPNSEPTPVIGRRLLLADELFRDDVIIFDQLRSSALRYGDSTGPKMRVAYPDSPYLGLWSKPGANFICIEPWQGVADQQGFNGDFYSKQGVVIVEPGGEFSTRMSMSLI